MLSPLAQVLGHCWPSTAVLEGLSLENSGKSLKREWLGDESKLHFCQVFFGGGGGVRLVFDSTSSF